MTARREYAFRFATPAQRQLRAIDKPAAMRILAALTALGDDPYREDADVKKLIGPSGLYRLRPVVTGSREKPWTASLILVVKVGDRISIANPTLTCTNTTQEGTRRRLWDFPGTQARPEASSDGHWSTYVAVRRTAGRQSAGGHNARHPRPVKGIRT